VEEEAGEVVPGGGEAEGDSGEVDDDVEEAAPESGAGDAVERGEVVQDDEEKEGEEYEVLIRRVLLEDVDGPAADGCVDDGDGGDEDEAFVGLGLGTVAPGEIDEEGEEGEGAEGNDEESLRVHAAGDVAAVELADGGEEAEDDHGDGEKESVNAELAMDGDVVGGDETDLNDEEKDPESEGRAVKVDEKAGQRGEDHAGEEIGMGEPVEDGGEDEQGHEGEKDSVPAAVGLEGGGRRRHEVAPVVG